MKKSNITPPELHSILEPLLPADSLSESKNSISFLPPPALTDEQKRVRDYQNMGFTCYYHEDLNRHVAKGNFVGEKPLIAFRADTRNPYATSDNIFSAGFDVYSFSRCPTLRIPKTYLSIGPKFKDINSVTKCLTTVLCCSCWSISCPLYFLMMGCYTMYMDPCCGRSRYNTAYYGNWSALSLSRKLKEAKPSNILISPKAESEYWQYAVYLEGCVEFDKFSDHIDGDSAGMQEVFPADLKDQRLAGDHIIGAYNSKQINTFIFNKKFGGWDYIAAELRKNKVDIESDYPQCEIGSNELQKFLHEFLPNLNDAEQPRPQAMI